MSAVYKAIAAVQGELAKVGISKDGQNTQQNYRFRGIDQVYGALSPLLAKHGLCVLPRIIEREMHERVTVKEWNGQKKESVLFYVTVTAEFDFVSVEDGSRHTVRTYGEAMDSGDKATNKAMSAAYKYAAFMAFAIPTEGDNDADATTHEVAAKPANKPPAKPANNDGEGQAFPPGPCRNISNLKSMARDIWRQIESCGDQDQLDAYLADKDVRAVLAQAAELTGAWGTIYYGDGGDNPGLQGLIAKKSRELSLNDFIPERNPIAAG